MRSGRRRGIVLEACFTVFYLQFSSSVQRRKVNQKLPESGFATFNSTMPSRCQHMNDARKETRYYPDGITS